MSTATATRKPMKKQEPRIARLHHFGSTTVLGITAGKDTTFYKLERIASDFGVAFRLEKAQRGNGPEESYDVLLHGRESSCTCKGNTYCGHCKHVESLQSLIAAGKIEAPASKPAPAPCPMQFDDP